MKLFLSPHLIAIALFCAMTAWTHTWANGAPEPKNLPNTIEPRLTENGKKEQKRREAVALAIASKKVIQGMIPDEVIRALGKPERVESNTTGAEKIETWSYLTYREQPEMAYTVDSLGHPIVQNYYIKVPVGSVTLKFSNDVVTSVSEVRSIGLGATTTPTTYGETPITVPVIPDSTPPPPTPAPPAITGNSTSSPGSATIIVERPLAPTMSRGH